MSAEQLQSLARNLRQGDDGIWVARSSGPISYPESGNDDCFTVEDQSFWFRHRNRCLAAVVRRFPPDGTLFDVGGGNGFVAKGLIDAGIDVALLEPGPSGVRNARVRGVETLICSTLEDAGFHDGSIAGAGMFDVLEHIEDDEGTLRYLARILRPSGRLYLTVPAYMALWSTEDDEGGHFRRYTLDELRGKLRAAGFEIDYASYFFGVLPLPIFLFRTLPTKLGQRKESSLERNQQEHAGKRGIVGGAVDWFLEREYRVIERGGTLPFGGSCLVVARRR